MVTAKKCQIMSNDGSIKAYIDSVEVEFDGQAYPKTVRTSACEILSFNKKCSSCFKYRSTLRSMHNRSKKMHSSLNLYSKFRNNQFLVSPQKILKIDSLRKQVISSQKKIMSLKGKINKMNNVQGEFVEEGFESDLMKIMRENSSIINKTYPEGSFARLFWDEQFKAATVNNGKQVRWHPMIIKWCLLMSSSAYHALRSSGFIKLPSERTLRDYTNYFIHRTGFQDDVDKQIATEMNRLCLPDTKKYVSLSFDEMKIKEGLVYNKNSGEIVGYTDLGEVLHGDGKYTMHNRPRCTYHKTSIKLIELPILYIGEINEQLLNPPVAKYILVFMVRGIFFHLQFPYSHFATCGVTGELLFPIFWEAVRRLESLGLTVISATSDGASSNRKFFRMHYDSKDP